MNYSWKKVEVTVPGQLVVIALALFLLFCAALTEAHVLDVSAHMEITEIRDGRYITVMDQDGEIYGCSSPTVAQYREVGDIVLVVMHFLKADPNMVTPETIGVVTEQLFQLNYITVPMMFDLRMIEDTRKNEWPLQ